MLILGSLPGEASLAAQRYYAHPANQFWRLVGAMIGIDLAARDYDARLATLDAAGIGVWDVVASATRRGSLDTAIRAIEANPLADLVASLPALRAVAFNGATAARIGTRMLVTGNDLPALVHLPSSSAAYCAMSFEEKGTQWNSLRKFLGNSLQIGAHDPILPDSEGA